MGQLHSASAGSEIGLVHMPHTVHVPFQGLHQAGWQYGAPVLVSLAAAHRDAALLQVHSLDPQAGRLHGPQATAIQQLGHQGLCTIEMTQNGPHLPHCEHHGKSLPPSGPDHPLQVPHITAQYPAVEKQQRREGLVPGLGAHPLLRPQMAEESIDLRLPHLARMAHPVKAQKPP